MSFTPHDLSKAVRAARRDVRLRAFVAWLRHYLRRRHKIR